SHQYPGTERQPSSITCSPSVSTSRGLIIVRAPSPSLASKTAIRSPTPIWGAAKPTPGASYMVSFMSSTSLRILSSISSTGFAGVRNTGSPNFRMGKMAIVDQGTGPGPFLRRRGIDVRQVVTDRRRHRNATPCTLSSARTQKGRPRRAKGGAHETPYDRVAGDGNGRQLVGGDGPARSGFRPLRRRSRRQHLP